MEMNGEVVQRWGAGQASTDVRVSGRIGLVHAAALRSASGLRTTRLRTGAPPPFDTYIPDEFMMQTLAMNGKVRRHTLSGGNQRMILWTPGSPNPDTLTSAPSRRPAAHLPLCAEVRRGHRFDILDVLDQRLRADQLPPVA